jgi:hypothetical protein
VQTRKFIAFYCPTCHILTVSGNKKQSMEYQLKGKLISKSIDEEFSIRSDVFWQNMKKPILVVSFICVSSFILGIKDMNEYAMVTILNETTYFNLNFFFTIAISSLFVTLLLVRFIITSKMLFIKTKVLKQKKYDQLDEVNLKLTDQFIEINNNVSLQRLNWDLFERVDYIKNHIFLFLSDNPYDSIAIDLEMLHSEQLNEFKSIVNSNIKNTTNTT